MCIGCKRTKSLPTWRAFLKWGTARRVSSITVWPPPRAMKRNVRIQCRCSIPSSFTAHFCLMFNLRVWSAPTHCSFIWWITSPNAAPLTKPCFSSVPPSVPSPYLGLSAVLWSLYTPGLEGTHGYSKLQLLQPPWLSGQGLPCLWDSLMVLFIICIGNAGLLHPGLCFPWWLQVW